MKDIRLLKSVDLQTGIKSITIDHGNIKCGLDDGRIAIIEISRFDFVSYFDNSVKDIKSVEVLG